MQITVLKSYSMSGRGRQGGKGSSSEVRSPGLMPALPLPSCMTWTSHLTSLNCCFFIYEIGIMILSRKAVMRVNEITEVLDCC